MDDTTAPEVQEPGATPSEQPSATAPTGDGEKLLPQSQVNALIAKARREGAESAAKKQTAPTQTTTATTAPASVPDVVSQMAARIEEMEMRGRFDRLAIKAGIDDAQAEDLFDLYKAQRPQDPAAWLTDKAQKFGLGRKPAAPTPITSTQQTQAKTPVPPVEKSATATPIKTPSLGAPAPGDSLDVEALVASQPLNMSDHDYANLVAKVGPQKAMQMVQANVNAYLKTVRLIPENRRRR